VHGGEVIKKYLVTCYFRSTSAVLLEYITAAGEGGKI
jgi:hypothetical protein